MHLVTLTLANKEPPIQTKLDLGNVCFASKLVTLASEMMSRVASSPLKALDMNKGLSELMLAEHARLLDSAVLFNRQVSL